MRARSLVALLSTASLFVACGGRSSAVIPGNETPDAAVPDGKAPDIRDAGADATTGDASVDPWLSLRFVSPVSGAHVRSMLDVLLGSDTGAPAAATVSIDGVDVGTAPVGTKASFDVSRLAEGAHSVAAHASERGTAVNAGPVPFVIDRTAPHVVGVVNLALIAGHAGANGLRVFVDEALTPESLAATKVTVNNGAATVSAYLRFGTDPLYFDILPTSTTLPAALTARFDVLPQDASGFALEIGASKFEWMPPAWEVEATSVANRSGAPQGSSLAVDADNHVFFAYATRNDVSVERVESNGLVRDFGFATLGSEYAHASLGTNTHHDVFFVASDYQSKPRVASLRVLGRASDHWVEYNDGLPALVKNPWEPSFAVGATGVPSLFWMDSSETDATRLMTARWEGNAWQFVGDISFRYFVSYWLRGALDKRGDIVAAYGDYSANLTFFPPKDERRSINAAVGDISNFGDLPLGVQPRPTSGVYLAGVARSTTGEGRLMLRECTSDGCKTSANLPLANRWSTTGAVLDLDAGRPVVGWTDRAKTDDLPRAHAARFVEGGWETLGSGLLTDVPAGGTLFATGLVVDQDGQLHFATDAQATGGWPLAQTKISRLVIKDVAPSQKTPSSL